MPVNLRLSTTCDEATYNDVVVALTLRILDPTCTEAEARRLTAITAAIIKGATVTSITEEVPDATRV